MKFGKFIQAQQAEWAGPQYINYKALKKIINSVQPLASNDHVTFTTLAATAPPNLSPNSAALLDDAPQEYQALKTAFFFRLERELEKVNSFYLQKEAEFKVRLRSLVDKKRILQGRKGHHIRTSLISLKDAFVQFQDDLTKLQKFVELNATGFRKILKKWDKRSKSSTKELYLSRQIEIQPCFNNEVLAELTDAATTNITELDALLSDEKFEPASRLAASEERSSSIADDDVIGDNETELIQLAQKGHVSEIRDFLDKRHSLTGVKEDKDFLSRVFLRICTESTEECLRLLLATGEVNCNLTEDISNRTCMHEAAISGRLDLLRLCSEHGATLNIRDVYGRSPLHYAAMYGHHDCAMFLISGTDINGRDHDGCTPLVYSIIGGHTKCVEICIQNSAEVEPQSPTAPIPLTLACQYGHHDIATLLLQTGAQVVSNADGLSPLHVACREGHHTVAQLLIVHRVDVDAKENFNGWTPIFYAASEGHYECATVLLKAGCKVDVKDESDWLPWTHALYRGHIAVAKLLEVPSITPVANGSLPSVSSAADVVGKKDIKPMAPSGLFGESNHDDDVDMDSIPSLLLPPPIIPFRIYGHNYLDKKYHVQINFGSFESTGDEKGPITLFGSRQLSSLKLIISSKPEVGVPYSVILPLKDDFEGYTFLVDDLSNFSLQFDIYPTFGTKVIGRAVALPSQTQAIIQSSWNGTGEGVKCLCPLFDTHLKVVGELSFEFSVVKPFNHSGLQIGGKVETYWKSTKIVNTTSRTGGSGTGGGAAGTGGSSETTTNVQSFITASSLAEEYVHVCVQVTKDGVPLTYPDWFLPVAELQIPVSSVTYSQARRVLQKSGTGKGKSRLALPKGQRMSNQEWAKVINESVVTLEEVLTTLPSSVGVSIEIKYPTNSESRRNVVTSILDANATVDAVLQTVYDHANDGRSIIFSSFNPVICTAMNWKQPNYGVFFGTRCGYEEGSRGSMSSSPSMAMGEERQQRDGGDLAADAYGDGDMMDIEGNDAVKESDRRCTSIKEAVRFAKNGNLLGVVCEATPLVQVPTLINTIKESGLILATFGQANTITANVSLQESSGVDAIIADGLFKYNIPTMQSRMQQQLRAQFTKQQDHLDQPPTTILDRTNPSKTNGPESVSTFAPAAGRGRKTVQALSVSSSSSAGVQRAKLNVTKGGTGTAGFSGGAGRNEVVMGAESSAASRVVKVAELEQVKRRFTKQNNDIIRVNAVYATHLRKLESQRSQLSIAVYGMPILVETLWDLIYDEWSSPLTSILTRFNWDGGAMQEQIFNRDVEITKLKAENERLREAKTALEAGGYMDALANAKALSKMTLENLESYLEVVKSKVLLLEQDVLPVLRDILRMDVGAAGVCVSQNQDLDAGRFTSSLEQKFSKPPGFAVTDTTFQNRRVKRWRRLKDWKSDLESITENGSEAKSGDDDEISSFFEGIVQVDEVDGLANIGEIAEVLDDTIQTGIEDKYARLQAPRAAKSKSVTPSSPCSSSEAVVPPDVVPAPSALPKKHAKMKKKTESINKTKQSQKPTDSESGVAQDSSVLPTKKQDTLSAPVVKSEAKAISSTAVEKARLRREKRGANFDQDVVQDQSELSFATEEAQRVPESIALSDNTGDDDGVPNPNLLTSPRRKSFLRKDLKFTDQVLDHAPEMGRISDDTLDVHSGSDDGKQLFSSFMLSVSVFGYRIGWHSI
ncbi:phosphate system positive regulatory protein pho81 [Quaeritorhiza haematococci]|nr:phosphate system positive regulatory protein pho81 [Quaeritorhiza haematococci]